VRIAKIGQYAMYPNGCLYVTPCDVKESAGTITLTHEDVCWLWNKGQGRSMETQPNESAKGWTLVSFGTETGQVYHENHTEGDMNQGDSKDSVFAHEIIPETIRVWGRVITDEELDWVQQHRNVPVDQWPESIRAGLTYPRKQHDD